MANKMVMNEKNHQIQVGYMLNPGLNIIKASTEQVESNLAKNFSSTTMTSIIRVLRKDNTHVISLIMFYENRSSMIFKVLS